MNFENMTRTEKLKKIVEYCNNLVNKTIEKEQIKQNQLEIQNEINKIFEKQFNEKIDNKELEDFLINEITPLVGGKAIIDELKGNKTFYVKSGTMLVYLTFTITFFEYLQNKYNNENAILFKLVENVLNKFKSIMLLYINNDFLGSIGSVRPLYEAYIIYLLISNNRALEKPYLDYGTFRRIKMLKGSKQEKSNELENEIINELKKLEEEYDMSIFKRTFGWFEVLENNNKEKELGLSDLAKKLQINDRDLYQITSEFIHSSSFSWNYDENDITEIISSLINESIKMVNKIFAKFMVDISTKTEDRLSIYKILESFI